ncbi:MAG: hypothetical protein EU548_03785 [Promethearchaeota archaeon]|nr:MAG: hypothetical protein EU548_03785 [Candidatus Lokiarchaeota archaeon]
MTGLKRKIQDKIIKILTDNQLTKPEIFDKLPPFKNIDTIRLINDFLENKIEEGVIKKRFINKRVIYGIFDDDNPKFKTIEQAVDESKGIKGDKQADKQAEIQADNQDNKKDWSEADLQVKIGKTVYLDPKKDKKSKKKKKVQEADDCIILIKDNKEINEKFIDLAGRISGSGSQDKPFLIKGLTFDGKSKKNGLEIKNTDSYCIIEDCIFRNCKNFGIMLVDVKNIRLINNRIVLNNKNGIILNKTSHIELRDNYILNNQIGLKLVSSEDNVILKNEINSNTAFGLILDASSKNKIKENIGSHNGVGINLMNSTGNDIINNEITSNKKQGLHLINSIKNQIKENKLLNNGSGIEIVQSSSNHLRKNDVKFNKNDGISLFNSSSNNIEENITIKNKCGIYLDRCSGNKISKNKIKPNAEETLYLFESFENDIS